ncbi:hypothetical protein NFC81_05955 [Salinispirillum sp. LH 10-3-1]|uniref:Uncharacterized protein n=1 Tax=Salinispirillum sp. LH 10-3-1 TaxID=2952525 RepID=A0AB38YJ95_9GAMM
MLNLSHLRSLLKGVAETRSTLPYQAVIKALALKSPAMKTLTQALETLQWEDAVLGRPQLTSVVVQKGKEFPRPGYFLTANTLNLYAGPEDGTEAEMWHQDQLEKVWELYSDDEPA